MEGTHMETMRRAARDVKELRQAILLTSPELAKRNDLYFNITDKYTELSFGDETTKVISIARRQNDQWFVKMTHPNNAAPFWGKHYTDEFTACVAFGTLLSVEDKIEEDACAYMDTPTSP